MTTTSVRSVPAARPRRRRPSPPRYEDLLEGFEAVRHARAALLYDGVLQDLYALRVLLHAAPAADARLAALAERLRAHADGLTPPSLAAFGLGPALDALGALAAPATAVRVAFEAPPLPPGRTATFLYRIAQEAVRNVADHAGSAGASVVVEAGGGGLTLTVSDDGAGFAPPPTFRTFVADGRYGLHRADAYAQALGGTLTVRSAPGSGTTVSVTLLLGPPPR